MFKILNADLNKKDKFTCKPSGRGLMDQPVRWDEETVVADRLETSHTAWITLIISYLVKQYFKLDKL
jgi:hypothetical protein